jgi:predicted nucleotidyltransferase
MTIQSTDNPAIPVAESARFCQRWKIRELAFFGSVLRDAFGPKSDVDVPVAFSPDSRWTLLDLARMRSERQGNLGRGVDLVSRRGLEASRNHFRREGILLAAGVVYAESQGRSA